MPPFSVYSNSICCFAFPMLLGIANPGCAEVRQLTSDPKNHDLDNNQNYSSDGKWLVYDTRNPGIGESKSIEKVHIETGEMVVVYEPKPYLEGQGPGAGAASFSPVEDRLVFIHGPWASTGLPYDFTWRRGGLVPGEGADVASFADARDITPPYTPGALRGGTHRHEWDGTGIWLGYTYNDEIMKKAGTDLRTIGVTKLGSPVEVADRNEDKYEGNGEGFSALVVRVVPDPKPGSDEVNRAAGDSWVGLHGYAKEDGTRQLARGFIGRIVAKEGREVEEVFIVDIPADITKPGEWGPLEGTDTAFPAPPEGASQRRLTWTEKWKHPGAAGTCWSSPDGQWITFLANDDRGMAQIFAVTPTGGDPVQVTRLDGGVACAPRWSPSGNGLVAVSRSGRLFIVPPPDGSPGEVVWITERAKESPPHKPVWSTTGETIAFNRKVKSDSGIYTQVFVVDVPERYR